MDKVAEWASSAMRSQQAFIDLDLLEWPDQLLKRRGLYRF
jgi:hypothetical protein